MKSFFAAIAIAGAAQAECWSTDNGMGQQCDDEYTECWDNWSWDPETETETQIQWCEPGRSPVEEAMRGIRHVFEDSMDFLMNPNFDEVSHGMQELQEDLECWWAAREPVTSCHKWEVEAEREACWNSEDQMEWNWEEERCMDMDEARQYRMWDCYTRDGDECTQTWNIPEGQNELDGWCEWTCPGDEMFVLKNTKMNVLKSDFDSHFKAVMKNAPGPVKAWKNDVDRQFARVFSTIEINADIQQFDEIFQEQEDIDRAAEEMVGDHVAHLTGYLSEWGEELQGMVEAVHEADMANYERLANLIVDSVTVDDIPLRDMTGDPETWMMARVTPGASTVRSLFALDKVVMQEDVSPMDGEFEGPSFAHVTIEVPSMEEAQAYLEEVNAAAEKVQSNLESLMNSFLETVGEVAEDLGEDLEDEVARPAMDIANDIGDKLKDIAMNNVEVEFALAQKTAKKTESHNYGKAAAGVVFGAIALSTVAVMIANRKKTVAEHEESLL